MGQNLSFLKVAHRGALMQPSFEHQPGSLERINRSTPGMSRWLWPRTNAPFNSQRTRRRNHSEGGRYALHLPASFWRDKVNLKGIFQALDHARHGLHVFDHGGNEGAGSGAIVTPPVVLQGVGEGCSIRQSV